MGAVWPPKFGYTRTVYAGRVLEYERRHLNRVRWRMTATARRNQPLSESKPRSLLKFFEAPRNPAHCKVWLMHTNPAHN